jgi:AraC-like DNA-binding protein
VIEQTYRERPPAAALAPYLSCVWVQEVVHGSHPYTHRTVPNGSAELLVEIGGLPRVVGPQTGPTEETLTGGTTVVGVRFRPGAAPSVLGMPASELVDLTVGANELWGATAVALGERVAAAASPQEALAALEGEIFARLRDADGPDPVAVEAVGRLLPWRGSDVASLPSALYVSERQLRRRFDSSVGFAPKVLQRMLRFQGFLALAHAHGRPRGELAMLAAEAGYADQSHLTREALRLAGRSPRAILLEAEEHCAPGHDHTASYGPLLHPHAAA